MDRFVVCPGSRRGCAHRYLRRHPRQLPGLTRSASCPSGSALLHEAEMRRTPLPRRPRSATRRAVAGRLSPPCSAGRCLRRRRVLLLATGPSASLGLQGLPPARERHRHGARLRSGLRGNLDAALGVRHGFFASVDGRRPRATGPNGRLGPPTGTPRAATPPDHGGHRRLRRPRALPLCRRPPRTDVRILEVANDFFGGNIGVAGCSRARPRRALAAEPEGERYLLPDVCLSQGRFLDGTTLADLPRTVEVIRVTGRRCAPCSTGGPSRRSTRRDRLEWAAPTRRIASGRPPLVEFV